LIVLQQKNEMH